MALRRTAAEDAALPSVFRAVSEKKGQRRRRVRERERESTDRRRGDTHGAARFGSQIAENGVVTGAACVPLFNSSGLSVDVLRHVRDRRGRQRAARPRFGANLA